MKKDLCGDYKPGTVMGKSRPVCKYYMFIDKYGKDIKGACSSDDHFMCEYFMDEWRKKNKKE